MKPVVAFVGIYWLSACASYEHHQIRAEQERQLQEQRESAALIDSQMPAEERKVMDEVAAADERRQQAAIQSRARQIESTNIPDTTGVDNRNHPVEDAVHGATWSIGTDGVKEALR